MSDISCSNHTCQKAINTQNDNHVMCSLCRDAIYCSEECRMIDWPAHACPNVVKAPAIGLPLAVPYYYEDMMPADMLEAELADPTSPLNQSFLLTHVGSNMKITQWQQAIGDNVSYDKMGGLGRGAEPPSKYLPVKFNVKIWDSFDTSQSPRVTLGGVIGDRAIHANSEDEQIKQLAIGPKKNWLRRLTYGQEKQSTSLILWPIMPNSVEFRSQGQITAHLQIGDAAPMPIGFAYNDLHKLSKAKATLMKHFQTRLRLKFPGKDTGIKEMHTIRATNTKDGTEIFLTFLVSSKKMDVDLVDVEIAIPIRKLPANPTVPENKETRLTDQQRKSLEDLGISKDEFVATEDSIYCDATKLEHMVGLTMACEYAATQIKAEMIAAPSNLAAFEEAAAVVRKYTREFSAAREAGGEFTEAATTPMHVNAAVYTAVNALQEVGLSLGSSDANKFLAKLSGESTAEAALGVALKAIANLRTRMVKARGSKIFSNARKGAIKKELESWRSAIRLYVRKDQATATVMQPAVDAIDEAEATSTVS